MVFRCFIVRQSHVLRKGAISSLDAQHRSRLSGDLSGGQSLPFIIWSKLIMVLSEGRTEIDLAPVRVRNWHIDVNGSLQLVLRTIFLFGIASPRAVLLNFGMASPCFYLKISLRSTLSLLFNLLFFQEVFGFVNRV